MCVYMYTFMYLCIMHMHHMHAMHSCMCVHVVCTYICVLHTCSPCVHMCMDGWIPHARSARMYVFIHVYHMLAVHVLCVYICIYVCINAMHACSAHGDQERSSYPLNWSAMDGSAVWLLGSKLGP